MTEITALTVPQQTPNTTINLCKYFRKVESSDQNNLLYSTIGKTKTSAVQVNAPIKLMKRPNLGTAIAPIAVNATTSDLAYKRRNPGKLFGVGRRL